MLKSPLFWKIVTLSGAMLLLLIPLPMVRPILVERSDYRSAVEDGWSTDRYSRDRSLYRAGR